MVVIVSAALPPVSSYNKNASVSVLSDTSLNVVAKTLLFRVASLCMYRLSKERQFVWYDRHFRSLRGKIDRKILAWRAILFFLSIAFASALASAAAELHQSEKGHFLPTK
jgi:uncharacterized membrane protein YkvI